MFANVIEYFFESIKYIHHPCHEQKATWMLTY